MSKKTNSDEITPRDLAKTFPWIGLLFMFVIGYILYKAVIFQEIVFNNTRFTGPNIVSYSDRPYDYYLILVLLSVLFLGAVGYVDTRMYYRNKLCREDRRP